MVLKKETTMNPGSQWIVEFGERENLAREQCWKEKTSEREQTTDSIATPSLGRRCLGVIGHLLLVAGVWLKRQAGEVYPADGDIGAMRRRRVDPGTPSWT
jgi:hypothetical protein